MQILIVEDEQDLAGPLAALLRREGYGVVWVDALKPAYQALAACAFDLIVLDVMLPEGEDAGFRFARSLREAGFTNRILFLTARDSVEDRARGLHLGGDDYLVKPFSLKVFLARVRAFERDWADLRRREVAGLTHQNQGQGG